MKLVRMGAALLLGLAIVTGLVLLGTWSYRVYREARTARDLAYQARALVKQGLDADKVAPLCDLVSRLDASTRSLQADLAPHYAAIKNLAWLPWAGAYLRQADLEMETARELSQGGAAACQAALPLAKLVRESAGVQKIAAELDNQSAGLRDADAHLLKALAYGEQVRLDSIPAAYQDDFQTLMTVLPYARRALGLALSLPEGVALLRQAQELRAADLDGLAAFAQKASAYTARLQAEYASLRPFLKSAVSGASTSGGHDALNALDAALAYAGSLAEAGSVLGQAVQSIERAGQDGGGADGQPAWAGLLIERRADFARARGLLAQAREARAQIDLHFLPKEFQTILSGLDGSVAQADLLLQLAQRAPGLLGSETPQTYLVMVQNRDELRATGGFVSAFGLARLDAGRLSMLEVDDSTQFNYVAEVRRPPEALGYLMQAGYWVARDANWSPDFPTAARQTQELYRLSTGVPTDGALAFDQSLLVALLKFFGPVDLPAEGLTVDAQNIETVMVQYRASALESGNGSQRKAFMSLLAQPLLQRIAALHDPRRQIDLAKLLLEQIQGGHLLVYLNDPEAEQLLGQLGLDGAVRPGSGDYLMLVDSNVGFSKMDLYVERSLAYAVDLRDVQRPSASLRMTYRLPVQGSEPCRQGVSEDQTPGSGGYYFVRCYWDYWRVLLAPGASLKTILFDPVPASFFEDSVGWKNEAQSSAGENGAQQVAGLLVLPPGGQAKVVALDIQLPRSVLKVDSQNRLVYSLRLQKQAGIAGLPVEISLMAPPGFHAVSSTETWTLDPSQNRLSWRGTVQGTTDFQVVFESSK